MDIRFERPEDCREVEVLTREAFWNVYRPGCTEHYVLRCYRSNPDFIPELDFVAEEDGRIIGRVMEKCGFVPTGETVIDESQYQGADHPIKVLRLIVR